MKKQPARRLRLHRETLIDLAGLPASPLAPRGGALIPGIETVTSPPQAQSGLCQIRTDNCECSTAGS